METKSVNSGRIRVMLTQEMNYGKDKVEKRKKVWYTV